MDGILIINKPQNYTSHDVVAIVRKKINEKKCGHIGTLDPNATGVLPILVGQATKISKYLIEHNKTYEAILQLGEKKDTGDSLGKTIEKKEVPVINKQEIEKVLQSFKGESYQIPPMYSAIKVNGKKLYQYAREGKKIEVEPRLINISDITLININKKDNQIDFRVNCSKGTYIRTLCEDIAVKAGTVRIYEKFN
jgi:tRNA pseudouridine55 synthase